MAEQPISLLPYYQGWDTYQALLIKAVEPLSPDQLSLRAAPHLRSIGENAAHIVGTRAGWLYFQLEMGGESMVSLAKWNMPDQPARSAAELVNGLEATWHVIQDTLSHWTFADLSGIVHDTDENGVEQIYTRQWVIWHLIEHDLHHGGELSFTLGMYGLMGITI
ncbi:MAG TPA: DinB family protein [Aggregatilineaceae bacterium]|nr:DinB family protein [Aggregatilineaceae bacterium]